MALHAYRTTAKCLKSMHFLEFILSEDKRGAVDLV